MKIVYASTPMQEQQILDLFQTYYSDVFPLYFSDEEIRNLKKRKVLHNSSGIFEYFGTLKEAYQVITALQTIKAILESDEIEEQYCALFEKNVYILKDFGLHFPFEFHHFNSEKMMNNDVLSIFTKAANELLI